MEFPFLSHHGSTRGTGGLCHQLHLSANRSLLVDCGLNQDVDRGIPVKGLGFPVQGIRALVITHVHTDHIGRIPELLAAGYDGPIICSEPSAHLLPLMLESAFNPGFTYEPGQVARYTQQIERAIVPLPFGVWYDILESGCVPCRIRLQPAGHVLGSAYVECDVFVSTPAQATRFVFSGYLGGGLSPLLSAPVPPERADILVLESTYGDRLHGPVGERQQLLEQVIERALADQGTVLIPASCVGRTQELLYDIEAILHKKSLMASSLDSADSSSEVSDPVDWPQLPIILDSPLAVKLTSAYRRLSVFWAQDARLRQAGGRAPLGFKQLISIESASQHRLVVNHLASTGKSAIVVAGNGMCSGGRIVSYLKAMLEDPRHEVVFTGYQGKGTPGAVIQASEGAQGFVAIDLDAQLYEVRAKVAAVSGYSAHADQAGLLAFACGMQVWPGQIILVHGEDQAKKALAKALNESYRHESREVSLCIPD